MDSDIIEHNRIEHQACLGLSRFHEAGNYTATRKSLMQKSKVGQKRVSGFINVLNKMRSAISQSFPCVKLRYWSISKVTSNNYCSF